MKPLAATLALLCAFSCLAAENPFGLPDGLYSEITTPKGVVVSELFFQKTPMTVANHVGLVEGTLGPTPGKSYYEGAKWHRVVADFVVQGGTNVDRLRLGYSFPDEIVPGLRHDSAGTMQMANSGPDSNGSQFCFMLSPQQRLNYEHTVFGHVVRGLDVLPKIQVGDTMSIKILRLGPAAQAFKADKATFDALTNSAKRYTGARTNGPDTPFDDPDKILQADRTRHFNFKLTNFERFTGRRIGARLLAKTPEGNVNDYMRAMAKKLGTDKVGAFALYTADTGNWHLWIGDDSISDFIGGPAPTDPAEIEKVLHKAKQDFFAAAGQTAAPIIAKAETTNDPANPATDAQKTKLRVDAVMDSLIFKLEPK
jgi:cyclophilin family peptidyl-prolyl cis-trans isomerase